MAEETINLGEWYTATDAAKRLTANSGRHIDISYVRTLGRYNKVDMIKLSERSTLYRKSQIDSYVVEGRGAKSARAKRQKALEKKEVSNAA